MPLVSQAASSGLAGSGAVREGDRDIWAVALEMNFPILKNLEIGAAIRYDDYSDFGGTTNPKVSFRYTPVDVLLMRASYNTGFAAPTLTASTRRTRRPSRQRATTTRVLCPNGVPNSRSAPCRRATAASSSSSCTGGNADLKPEKSDAWTVGFVLQPTPEISFGLDYWNYYIKDSISAIGDQSIFADPAKYANLFVRCSAGSAGAAQLRSAPARPRAAIRWPTSSTPT